MIEIADGLHERHRQPAGLIYYEAFRRKLQPLVGKPAETTAVLAAGLNLRMTLGALVDGELRGLAGLHHGGGVFSHVYVRDALARLGPVRGLYAWAALNLFAGGDHCPAGELRVAALAVDAARAARGWVRVCWKRFSTKPAVKASRGAAGSGGHQSPRPPVVRAPGLPDSRRPPLPLHARLARLFRRPSDGAEALTAPTARS